MRVAILSDVHSNFDALNAVLREVDRLAPDQVVFLGDAVGYGPDPTECLDLLRERCRTFLLGNHDAAAVGLTDAARFNELARRAIEWTGSVLPADRKAFLGSLALEGRLGEALLVHASPHEPGSWHYVVTRDGADTALGALEDRGTLLGFIGHTHVPLAFTRGEGRRVAGGLWQELRPEPDAVWLVNVGSVGQPRDGDPRASFALWDLEEGVLSLHRVEYQVASVQERMRQAGLPDYLARRLATGR